VFLETAHPAKFKDTIENIIQKPIEIPKKLQEFMKGTKESVELGKNFQEFKEVILHLVSVIARV
jgi:threonine synthase